ncbi:protein-tyrosine-phosphatase [Streptomyces sp. SID4934]|uniref:tyrosine-protein phosphatase n=1 Tax=unclassified Streptomyces TaxID=2593676 RepID=UPI00081EE7BF|nr:tyrosine-protein phosphatase [Streptomyces sp. ScaeMP-6W]MYQ70872.1 protein-tyrosine-phosphatase [Streptomyces sp. SID4934]SCD61067.1 protein-tyrosine phosphatase [Streptomyces sp. ScaeMP-6W]
MDSEPTGRAVEAATVANLRDLGGILLPGAGEGRSVRPGALLRSADLAHHDPHTDPVLTERGVQVVFDLRTTGEREAAPDVLPPGARPFVGDVLGTRPGAAPARLARYLEDPVLAEQELGGGRAERLFEDAYRRMVLSPGARSAYAALVQTAADDGTHPLLFHCTAGKDRTGWGAALLLLLLGAGQDAVRSEYLAVNDAVRARYEPHVRRFVERGGDPEIAAVLTEVRPAYLDVALDALTERWGDIERYAREALRVEAALDRLRAELTV